ncbi:MAG: DUF6314 family protein [Actinomycetota bacterium]
METSARQVTDTLGFLLGTWQVTRSIDDRRAGVRGSFDGTAVVAGLEGAGGLAGSSGLAGTAGPAGAPGGDLLRPGAQAGYTETGTLRFGMHQGPARRQLTVTRLDGGAVLLSFADGRPYIELDLSTGSCARTHPCRADTYEVTILVRSHDELEERWWVRGPAKDYRAVTTLLRLG